MKRITKIIERTIYSGSDLKYTAKYDEGAQAVHGGERLGADLDIGLGLYEKLGKPQKIRVTISNAEPSN